MPLCSESKKLPLCRESKKMTLCSENSEIEEQERKEDNHDIIKDKYNKQVQQVHPLPKIKNR